MNKNEKNCGKDKLHFQGISCKKGVPLYGNAFSIIYLIFISQSLSLFFHLLICINIKVFL